MDSANYTSLKAMSIIDIIIRKCVIDVIRRVKKCLQWTNRNLFI